MSTALELADQLAGLAEHLRAHPHLPTVNTYGNAIRVGEYNQPPTLEMHLNHEAAVDGPAGVLLWAKTLADVEIHLKPHGKDQTACTVMARGATATGVRIEAWDIDVASGDLYRWRGTEYYTPITLDQLAAYVAAGTVEHTYELAVPTFTADQLAEVEHWSKTPFAHEAGSDGGS